VLHTADKLRATQFPSPKMTDPRQFGMRALVAYISWSESNLTLYILTLSESNGLLDMRCAKSAIVIEIYSGARFCHIKPVD
jgi:hypothetical protein